MAALPEFEAAVATATGVRDFLEQLILGRLAPLFADHGVLSLAQLALLEERDLEAMRINGVGVRRRILKAVSLLREKLRAELEGHVGEGVQMESEPVHMDFDMAVDVASNRLNSTSSLYISTTVCKPDFAEVRLHRRTHRFPRGPAMSAFSVCHALAVPTSIHRPLCRFALG